MIGDDVPRMNVEWTLMLWIAEENGETENQD